MCNKIVSQSLLDCKSCKGLNYWFKKRKLLFLLFLILCVQLSKAQTIEGFEETVIPTSYTTASYALTSGTWFFNNAKKSTLGKHSGSYSCLIGSTAGSYITTPIIATGGVDSIVFWSSVSTGPANALQVLVSLNGATFYQIPLSPSSSITTTPSRYAAAVKSSSTNIQVKFLRASTTIYLDDIFFQPIPVIVPTITVSGTIASVNTVYGTASATPTSFSVSGVSMNEGILITAPAGFEVSTNSTSNYAASVTVGSAGIISATTIYTRLMATTLAGDYAGNIVLSSSGVTNVNVATVSSTISPYSLTVSGITGVNKIYDGTTTASITGTATLSSTINNDIISIAGTPAGTFENSIVGNGKKITISGLTLSGINSLSYTISPILSSANIIPLSLILNEALVSNKTYDGTNVAIITGTLSGIINADIGNVVFNSVATFSQVMVANNIAVISTSTLTGIAKDNYTLMQPIGLTANITKASQTIVFTPFTTPITTLTSGFSLSANASSGNPVSFTSSNILVATILGINVSVIGTGTTSIIASQNGDTNFLAAANVSQSLVVNRAPTIIYQHGFETGSFGDTVYSQAPSILSDNLNSTRWTIKTGVIKTFAGSGGTGTGSLGVLSGSSASPFTLYLNVQNGYSLTINSFSFWRYASTTISWNLTVNGIAIGSGTASATGLNTGAQQVLNAITGLTGVVKVQLILSGTGSFRIDDFTLNGNLISCGNIPVIVSQPLTQSICEKATLNLQVVANNVTAYQWRKTGINISGAISPSYSIVNTTIADGGDYDVLLTGDSYCSTNNSSVASITINPTPSGVSIIANPSSVCSGLPTRLTASYSGISELFEQFPLANFSVAGTGSSATQNNVYYQQGNSSILFKTDSNAVTNPALSLNYDVDLTKYGSNPSLQFYHICALEGTISAYDFGYVEYSINEGSTWTTFPANTYLGSGTLAGLTGSVCFSANSYTDWNSTLVDPTSVPNNSLWKKEIINLSPYTGNSKFRIRFRITTDFSNVYFGWLIDNVSIGSVPSHFYWSSTPAGYNDSSQNPLIVVSPVVPTHYILTATNIYGCTTQSNTIVNIKPAPVATISYTNNPFCNSADSQIVNIADKTGEPFSNAVFSSSENLSINTLTGTVNPALSAIDKHTITYHFTGENGCFGVAVSNVEINKIGSWKCGGIDSNWSSTNNWFCETIPTLNDDVIVSNSVAYYPIIKDSAYAKNIDIEAGASLIINGTLKLAGSIISAGFLDARKGNIILNGNTPQNITGKVLVKNITIDNTKGVTIGNALKDSVFVIGVYTPTAGILTTYGRLILVSDINGTAAVAEGSGNYITGNVAVERYHADKRAWLLISAPLTTFGTTVSGSIHDNWQQQTYITAPSFYTSTGMDAAPNNNTYAMLRWLGTAWGRVTNTNNDTSLIGNTGGTTADNKPFFLFVRGNRSVTPVSGGTNHSDVTLSATGALQMGDKHINIAGATEFALVANPYASPISLTSFLNDNAGLKNDNTYIYYWDANNSGSGGYTTAIYDGSKWGYTAKNEQNIHPSYIQSGLAFFVVKNGQSVVTFKETQKSTGYSSNTVFGNNITASVNVDLSNGTTYIDGVLTMYNNDYNAAVIAPTEDAYKFWGNEEGVAIIRSGTYLSVEARPVIAGADTTFLYMNKMLVDNNYTFKVVANGMPLNITAVLVDKYLHTSNVLDLTTTTSINFSIDTSAAARSATRFMLVFNTSALYAGDIKIAASIKAKAAVIDWIVATEKEVKCYTVEHSATGSNFIAMYTITANNAVNSKYSFIDNSPVTGNNYYRIKAINKDGSEQYSSIAKVSIGDRKEGMSIYPNPIAGRIMNVQLSNIAAGTYSLSMINAKGQQVMEQPLQHAGGSVTSTIQLTSTIASGIYKLRLTGNGKTYFETVVVK